ncbi:MAG: hypothetical protein HQ574_00270, partial [Chloroflexi bacterium]|nr:hypothetical protein [Chloroflexota bacterium]
MNSILTLSAIFYICLGVYSVSLIITALRKLHIYKIADYLLVILLGLFFLILLILFGSELSWWGFFPQGIRLHLPWYGMLLFSGVIFALTFAVFKTENPGWIWLGISLLVIAVAAYADARSLFMGNVNWGRQQEGFLHSILSAVVQAVSWGFFIILASVQVLKEYRHTEKTVVKQRAIYWTSALILYIGSSVLLMIGHEIMGSLLLLLTTIILNYLVLTYRLPDLKILAFQAAGYSLTGITIILIYSLGFLVLERFFVELSWYRPVYNGVFFSLVALIFFLPIHHLVNAILGKLISGEKNRTLEIRSYSKTLSSILDIELLSKVTIEMICESLEVRKGTLFLVDRIE